jgi:hypothetical protein
MTMMTNRRYPKKFTRQYSLTIVFIVIALLADRIEGQFPFPPSTEPCPSNADQTGYTTIAAMNTDMAAELERIENGGNVVGGQTYNMILCPSTMFSTQQDPLFPVLDGTIFMCGDSGSVTQNCVLTGGSTNVRVEDPGLEGYQFNKLIFIGVTFQDFNSRSVDLRAAAPAEAQFMDCIWQVRALYYLRGNPLFFCRIFEAQFTNVYNHRFRILMPKISCGYAKATTADR